MIKLLTHWVRGLTLSLLLMAVAGCRQEKDQARYRLTYSVFFPPTHVHAKLATQWARDVEAATQNRVRILVFTGASLTKASQCYQGVVDGISDIGMSCFAYTPGRFPLLEALDLPVGYRDGLHASRVTNQMIRRFSPKELDDVHLLYVHAHGPGVLASVASVENLSTFDTQKIRATGLMARVVKALGGQAIGMSQPETYDALSKGVVDATLCPVETLKGWRQGECVDHVLQTPALGYTTTMFVAMNRARWEALPQDIQEAITAVSNRYIDLHGQGWNAADKAGFAFMDAKQATYHTLTQEEEAKWQARIAPVFEDYVQRASQKDPHAQDFLEALRRAIQHTQEEVK